MSRKAKIVIRNLTKAFYKKQGSVTALDDINLTINDGEFVCLVGPSGCGKSTLLRILAGLENPSIGEFTIATDGEERPFNRWCSRKEVSFRGSLSKRMWHLDLKCAICRKNCKRANGVLFEKNWSRKIFIPLSERAIWGMKQRVSIARAFANDPEILLMDEPFAALDEQNKFILQEELLSIWSETGKTILFITHSIDEALLLSDRILLMSSQPGKLFKKLLSICHVREKLKTYEKTRLWQDNLWKYGSTCRKKYSVQDEKMNRKGEVRWRSG